MTINVAKMRKRRIVAKAILQERWWSESLWRLKRIQGVRNSKPEGLIRRQIRGNHQFITSHRKNAGKQIKRNLKENFS